jgi:hypothetical protein
MASWLRRFRPPGRGKRKDVKVLRLPQRILLLKCSLQLSHLAVTKGKVSSNKEIPINQSTYQHFSFPYAVVGVFTNKHFVGRIAIASPLLLFLIGSFPTACSSHLSLSFGG